MREAITQSTGTDTTNYSNLILTSSAGTQRHVSCKSAFNFAFIRATYFETVSSFAPIVSRIDLDRSAIDGRHVTIAFLNKHTGSRQRIKEEEKGAGLGCSGVIFIARGHHGVRDWRVIITCRVCMPPWCPRRRARFAKKWVIS